MVVSLKHGLRSSVRRLALDAGLPISTAYRYLHEGFTVLAQQAPDLHDVLERARTEGWSHVNLDGTLIETDRVRAKKPDADNDLWYSGKHAKQGGTGPAVPLQHRKSLPQHLFHRPGWA